MTDVLEFRRPPTPWQRKSGLDEVISTWRDSRLYRHFALDEVIPPRPAQVTPLPEDLDPRIANALRVRGVRELYSHQREAYERVRAGENLVVATPTTSGKSLCYNLPILQGFAEDPQARALYLFPTRRCRWRSRNAALRELVTNAGLRPRRYHVRWRHAGRLRGLGGA